MKLYYLTDGISVFYSRIMTERELAQEQEKAKICSDNSFQWVEASPKIASLPKDEIYRHIA